MFDEWRDGPSTTVNRGFECVSEHLYIAEKARKKERHARPAKINDLITPTIASHGRPAKVPSLSASNVNINGDGHRDRDGDGDMMWRSHLGQYEVWREQIKSPVGEFSVIL